LTRQRAEQPLWPWAWAVAAAIVGVQTGAAIVATRAVVHELGPASLACLRYAIGALCLLPFLRRRALWRTLAPRDLAAVALLGVLQFGVNTALLNVGLQTLPAGLGALLYTTFPLLTLVLAALLGRERFSLRALVGVLLSIAGVAVALRAPVAGAAAQAGGATMVLLAAGCGALCAVLYRPYVQRYAPLLVGAIAMGASVLALALPAWAEGVAPAAAALSLRSWGAVIFSGLSSGIGYTLWLWALAHSAPTRVTAFLALSPITALLLGAAWLGEPLAWSAAAGTVCVVLGLIVTATGPARGRS
jgi:drug/metabolite transporter (DMT)-like permease